MSKVIITRGHHGFKVETNSLTLKVAINEFIEPLIKPDLKASSGQRNRYSTAEPTHDEFFLRNESKGVYYFHDMQWYRFAEFLDRHNEGGNVFDIVMKDHELKDGSDVDLSEHNLNIVEPSGTRFDFQNSIVEYATTENRRHVVLEVQTGKGKTQLAMKSAAIHRKRFMVITKPSYVPKWVPDLTRPKNSLSIPREEVRVVGVKKSANRKVELDRIYKDGLSGKLDDPVAPCKAILVSSKALMSWIEYYLAEGDTERVDNLLNVIGVGFVVIDEVHEWFKVNYLLAVVLNPPRLMDLSATIIAGRDKFIERRYHERLPPAKRYDQLEYTKYIDKYAIYYHLTDDKLIRRINNMKMYNHIILEEQIMRNKRKLEAYLSMIIDLLNKFYLNSHYVKGMRSLLFFSTKKMCTLVTERLAAEFPHLTVARNIAGDNYFDFVEADIGVSTPGKSGAAVDIANLVLVLVTVNISKEDRTLQILGRARETPQYDLDPKVVFLHCQQLRKHCDYLHGHKKLMAGKVKNFRVFNSRYVIG